MNNIWLSSNINIKTINYRLIIKSLIIRVGVEIIPNFNKRSWLRLYIWYMCFVLSYRIFIFIKREECILKFWEPQDDKFYIFVQRDVLVVDNIGRSFFLTTGPLDASHPKSSVLCLLQTLFTIFCSKSHLYIRSYDH